MNFETMTREELVEYIKSLNEEQNGKYGLIWDKEKEPEKIVTDCDKKIPVLKEIKEREIKNNGQENILIEGDNFHSLTILNYTHKEKVDIIYIDPPYNTGHKDFKYNDHFVDSEDGYRHSKWLNFMEKRLKLARNLLKDSGVIFISIDDNEHAQLKLLCDKIFDTNNCLGILPTIMNLKGNQDEFAFAGTHEYTLVYAKNKQSCEFGQFDVDEEEIEKDWEQDDIGYYKKGATLRATGTDADRVKRPYMFYPILIKDDYIDMIEKDEYKKLYDANTKKFNDKYLEEIKKKYEDKGYYVLIPMQPDGGYGRWRWGFDNMYANKHEVIVNTNGGYSLYKKQRPTLGDIPSRKPKSLFYKAEYSSGNGTSQITNMFGKKVFDNPKPIELIKDFIYIGSRNKDALILDFFAGSGTTGHAVLELNQKDNGKRKFILCTNNENNICDEVTYPRIEKVINGYVDAKGKEVKGIPSNLKYYKTDFVDNTNNRDQLYYDLTEKCIPMLCLKEDCFEQISVTSEYMIFSNISKTKYTCIYFDIFGNLEQDFINKLENIDEDKVIYKFSLGDYVDETPFKNVKNYIIEAIPYKIVELYRKLVKLSKEEI